MSKKSFFLVLIFIFLFGLFEANAQCNLLRSQIDVSFNTDQDCAPVTVTDFTVTYYFNAPQNPADIEIRFEWNDPGNQVSVINIGNGLVAAIGNTEFTASAPNFTYFTNNDCALTPTSFLSVNGVLCPTSEELQLSPFWGTDDDGNGEVTINPTNIDVCFNNPVVNAVFTDTSEFNCRVQVEPDRPNQLTRHTQFVYGTNHNPASTIINLSLEDGGTQALTNGAGGLVTTQTRSGVTGGYFGPIEAIPTPALGPVSVSFPMNAPADLANLVGNTFEITLYNWNFCNPWNGDPVNPNYIDAIATTAFIVIVDAPTPSFVTRRGDAAGAITTTFCIGEDIYFDNQTAAAGGLDFVWELFDDVLGTIPFANSTDLNPTFSYPTFGQKLVRLTASNPTAQGSCLEVYELIINISPSIIADISLTDLSDVPISGQFCQDSGNSQLFDVRFSDSSLGISTVDSRWRWEFYDEANNLVFEDPPAGAFSTTILGPYDRVFSSPGVYRALLTIRDDATTCETFDEEFIYIYPAPIADFTSSRVCFGNTTNFLDNSTLTPINGESIVAREWDLNYDGVTFNSDPGLINQTTFDFTFPSAGTYNIALQVSTDQNSCSDLFVSTVTVDPLPLAQIIPDNTVDCSVFTVNFTNVEVGNQPDVIDQYIWELDEGSGFIIDSIQSPIDPEFSNTFTRDFVNSGSSDRFVDVRLRVVTENGCETISNVVTIQILPTPLSGFNSINYSPFDDNCSPVDVTFQVDAATQAQLPSDYTWTISDVDGQIEQQSTGTVPEFSYTFTNDTQDIKDYNIQLNSSLGGICTGDSSLTIRVNPIPQVDFEIDTVNTDCESFTLYAESSIKGMSIYHWILKVDGVTLFASSTDEDNFQFSINKVNAELQVEISLFITNFAGCNSQTIEKILVVEEEQNIAVDFSVTPTLQTLPEATIFLENLTNSGPWDFLWDFGDGTTSTEQNVSEYTYLQAGTYTISLTASFGDCIVTTVKSITINPIPPIVDFGYDPAFGCAPLTVNFTNLSQFALSSSYEWEFGDGSTSNAVNPTHTYFEPGIYSVSLTASNAFNQSTTEIKSQIIEVFETPLVQFDVRPAIVFVPDNPIFTNNQSIGATSFLWDFGDGTTSTEQEPTHFYQEEGFYDITLIGANTLGCADTLTRASLVEGQQNGRLLIPNAFSPNLNGPSGGDFGSTGVNDVFLPLTQGVSEFQMFIFNRWGEMLFETQSKEIGWDGYYNGKLCPQDVYVYKMNLVFENGRKTTRTGDVNLIR